MADLENIIVCDGHLVGVRKVGDRWQGPCPFCETNTLALSFNGGNYYCTTCGARGLVGRGE